MLTKDFSYDLDESQIAQSPVEPRDSCKMLVLGRTSGSIEHKVFRDITDYLRKGDLLVINETKVLPARLIGKKAQSEGVAEALLLKQVRPDIGKGTALWEALVRPGKRLKPGAVIEFFADDDELVLQATVVDWSQDNTRGGRLIELKALVGTLDEALHSVGRAPLPPYIHDYKGDPDLYQTVYAKNESSAAAPTAGLHFTNELLEKLQKQGVNIAAVELEIGLDTFRIVETDRAEDHHMHTEVFYVPQETVDAIERTHEHNGRVVAVGTTSMRSLESSWDADRGKIRAVDGESTSLFILPGYEFHVVDALITNFHVPKSTLMMLVSAFSSRENIMNAYKSAQENGYRFLSFGDAMLII